MISYDHLPGEPGWPLFPSSPGGPFWPGGPEAPIGPELPTLPITPWTPWSPLNPGSPSDPSSPMSPGAPCINISLFALHLFVCVKQQMNDQTVAGIYRTSWMYQTKIKMRKWVVDKFRAAWKRGMSIVLPLAGNLKTGFKYMYTCSQRGSPSENRPTMSIQLRRRTKRISYTTRLRQTQSLI